MREVTNGWICHLVLQREIGDEESVRGVSTVPAALGFSRHKHKVQR